MYPSSKAWILLESEVDSPISQQLTPSIKAKINPIDDRRQQRMTPGPAQVGSVPPMHQETITPHPANTLGSTSPIHQPTITPGPAQIGSVPPPDWPQQAFSAYENPYTQIPPIKVSNEMLPATIVAQFVKIWDKILNYTGEAYDILDDKIRNFLDTCYTVAIKLSQFPAVFSSILSRRAKDYFVYT